MIKQMVVGFYWNLMLGCWVWILRELALFKGSERSPGLLQDFEDGYIKHCVKSVQIRSYFGVIKL